MTPAFLTFIFALACLTQVGDYPQGAVTDPIVVDQGSNASCVMRGGSWKSIGADCRSATRYWFLASYRGDRGSGFRLAVVPAASQAGAE
jgi:formylglycine-generating enzyme required for sulfatase activity